MDERFTNLVEKFFDGTLSPAEESEFSNYMTRKECVEYFVKSKKAEWFIETGYRKMLKSETGSDALQEDEEISEIIGKYRYRESKETREKVREMHQEMLRGKRRMRILQFSSLAAILAALALIFTFMQRPDPQSLFKDYYENYYFLTKRGGFETPGPYLRSVELYVGSRYTESIEICRNLLEQNPDDAKIRFIYGINLLALDSIPAALEQFNALTGLKGEQDKWELAWAHWYASLCYLRMEEYDATLEELDALKDFTTILFDMEKVAKLRGEIVEMRGKK